MKKYFKFNLTLFFCFLMLLSIHAQTTEQSPPADSVYTHSSVPPEYPNGLESLYKELMSNVVFTNEDIPADGVRMIVLFVVEIDGSVSNVRIVSGVNDKVDSQVFNVLESSEKWQAAVVEDEKVRFQFVLPIRFTRSKVENETIGTGVNTIPFSNDNCMCSPLEVNRLNCRCNSMFRW